MKIKEFCENYLTQNVQIKVLSGFNGKILCKKFSPTKHIDIGERELCGVFPEINVRDSVATVVLCLWADRTKECEQYGIRTSNK